MTKKELLVPDEILLTKIYLVREQKVMLDRDLAELYGVETKRLKEQVKRNINHFPEDFMFQLTKEEFENWRSQFATSNSDKMGLRHLPFCFTEHDVLMLSSVLNSERAISVNITIMRVFTRMREMLLTHKDLLIELEEIRKKLVAHDDKIELVFQYLAQFIKKNEQESERIMIGFKVKE